MKRFNYSMEELLPIVADLSMKYTSGESSSITYDKARQLMGAVQYAILIYELESRKENELSAYEKIPARTAYERGYQFLCEKVKHVQNCYNRMIPKFVSFENENYNATVVRGISAFFLYYDPRFAPAETIITMDYPVAGGVKYRQGVLAIEEYLKKIELEQTFFAALLPEYVYHVLRSQPEDYKEQYYNICSIVWKDLLLKMVLREIGEEFRDIQSYIQRRTKTEVIEILKKTLHLFITEKYDCNLELESYLSLWLADYVAEMFQSIGDVRP